MNDEAKWQFIRRAHPPLLAFSFIQSLAFLSYPLPNDMASYFFDIFISSAKRKKSATGSDPGERTKISGVVPEASLNDLAMLKVGGSMNLLPILRETKFYTAKGTLSDLIALYIIIF
jgi:hypothetical protein